MAETWKKVEGLSALAKRMEALGDDMTRKTSVSATGAGARVIRNLAKQKAPIAPADYEVEGQKVPRGNLPKQIVVKQVPKSKRRLTSEHVVAVRGKRKDGYANRVGQLQEFGTVKQDPNPFMRPAFDEGKGPALDVIVKTLKRRVAKAEKGGK
ncbi:phage protein, HK97 gp10 family [Delftia acidovorans SPH-1]|uniref:Phage protein, HK97 gp10 family n=1 Tax=Delftia acidovorans (strain DSM 14801 / SPH-1) TaxID=398578 RepID=A9BYE2_DELAS|nr:HK97-gp10 family putative phage morphogenesis protein [Delftia acidovorans]ABX34281.1 phage protein, HK97 gp10 family [Delftia acidovorans SPH-1]QPS76339.1 HK97 gp10 family phage protein [Delftia acidovorans]